MSERVIKNYLTPSEEITDSNGTITTEGLLDEVSLYNLYDEGESPEQDTERILEITYPTDTLTTVIENTAAKLGSGGDLSKGAHVIGGGYGSGKSHIELVLYHLLTSSKPRQQWLNKHDFSVELPAEVNAAAIQALNVDQDLNRLSAVVGGYLDIDEWADEDTPLPTVHEIRDAIGDTPTAIFLDEFERWFGMARRSDYKEDNLAFLQNLLEAAGRDDTPLCVYVSLLYESADVESIAQRTNPFVYDLSARRDEKIQFLLHRLIGSVDDPDRIAALAKEYTDVYRQNDQIQFSDYHEMENRIERQYPFHPAALETLLDKYSEQDSHQDARGLLRLLTEILADNYRNVDLILTGNIDVFEYTNWFRFIDQELVGSYLNDYHRFGEQSADDGGEKSFDPYVEELLNIVLLSSLTQGGNEGANKRQMLLGTIRKGMNAHEIIQRFTDDVYGHAWHIHRINGEYAFDIDENPAARIEKKTDDIHKDDAIHHVENLIKNDLFRGRNNVYILNPVNTEQQNIPDNKTLKMVVTLSARANGYGEEFASLTTAQGQEFQNTIVIVSPQKRASIDTNTGIIELARKVVAGEQLKSEEEVLPDGFYDIHDQNKRSLRERVADKFGEAHRSTGRTDSAGHERLFPETLDVDADDDLHQTTLDAITPDSSQLRSNVEEEAREAGGSGIEYQYLLNDFYRNTEYPTLTDEQELKDTIDALCRDGVLEAGTYYEQRVRTIGNTTTLVHKNYIQEPDEGDDDKQTIKADTRHSSDADDDADDGGTTTDRNHAVGASQSAFECPQCGDELNSSTCACGFEFDASDLEEGTVDIEGGTVDDLLETFDDIQEELEMDQPSAETTRFPPMNTLDADNRPDLIDLLERKVGYGWDIHRLELIITGPLTGADLASRGIGQDELSEQVTIEETLSVDPEKPLNRQEIINLVWDMNIPEKASLSVWMEVEQDE